MTEVEIIPSEQAIKQPSENSEDRTEDGANHAEDCPEDAENNAEYSSDNSEDYRQQKDCNDDQQDGSNGFCGHDSGVCRQQCESCSIFKKVRNPRNFKEKAWHGNQALFIIVHHGVQFIRKGIRLWQ